MRAVFVPNASMQYPGDAAVKFDAVDEWITSVAPPVLAPALVLILALVLVLDKRL